MKNKEIIFFQNIIAPYRVDLFNNLDSFLKNTDLSIMVIFMRKIRKGRSWNIDKNQMKFNYEIGKGIYFQVSKNYDFHFNPNLLYSIFKSKNDIILGGSWNNFNILFLIFLKRLGLLKNTLHTWSEVNYLSTRKNNIIVKKIRSMYYNSIDGKFLIPGEMSEISFNKFDIDVTGRTIKFPNLINEKVFFISANDLINRKKNSMINIVIPARLIESRKGILNLFQSLGISRIKKVIINILGDGPDRNLITKFIESNKLHNHIKLQGNLNQTELIKFYKKSNFMILPSFIDPSPLSLVEGLFMKLPIMCSTRCGNHFETVINKENGILIDPYLEKSIIDGFDFMLTKRKEYEYMGEISFKLAHENFSSSIVFQNFINKI